MIEMRWVWHDFGKGSPINGSIKVSTQTYQKLQYRYREPMLSTGVNEYPPAAWIWSEWIDVPHSGVVV